MPYASRAQQGLFHSPNSPVGPSVVKDFDRASKGMKLPQHARRMSEGGEAMDDTAAKLAALKKMRDWMDQEEDERLRVTIDIDPNAPPKDEDPEVEANEEKEAAEHPEIDPGTIHEIAKDHVAEGVDESDPAEEEEESPMLARLKSEDPADKEKRLAHLKKTFGGFSK